MTLKQFTTLLIISSLSIKAFAQQEANEERWFEVEVIFFAQLGDKTLLNETFQGDQKNIQLPEYPETVDLLSPYIERNVPSLKRLLPYCDSSSEDEIFNIKKHLNFTPLSEGDSLQRLIPKGTNDEALDEYLTFDLEKNNAFCRISEEKFSEYTKSSATFSYNKISLDSIPSTIDNITLEQPNQPYLIDKNSLELTGIVDKLKRSPNFKPLLHLGFRHAPQTKRKAEGYKIFAGKNLYKQYTKDLHKYQQKLAQAELVSYQEISPTGAVNNNIEYTNDSHDNNGVANTDQSLTYDKKPAENEYSLEKESTKQLALISTQIEMQNKIKAIIAQAAVVSEEDITEINQSLDNNLPDNIVLPTAVNEISEQPPIMPEQPWFLDGILRIHLDHYLYITADFNVMNMTTAERRTLELSSSEPVKMQTIPFKQNRRVISKEIHYFDHPYMGMVIQIRKHERTKEALLTEPVNQLIESESLPLN